MLKYLKRAKHKCPTYIYDEGVQSNRRFPAGNDACWRSLNEASPLVSYFRICLFISRGWVGLPLKLVWHYVGPGFVAFCFFARLQSTIAAQIARVKFWSFLFNIIFSNVQCSLNQIPRKIQKWCFLKVTPSWQGNHALCVNIDHLVVTSIFQVSWWSVILKVVRSLGIGAFHQSAIRF